jgi:monoterpene epsilon-lactone hydrolase
MNGNGHDGTSQSDQRISTFTDKEAAFLPSDDSLTPATGALIQEPISSSTSLTHLMQSVALPSRVMASAFRIPFKIAMKGKRLPSWSTQMEVVIAAFRSACRNAPRDLSLIRAWTDVSIPDLILPKEAIVHSSRLHGLQVEWVFPHHLSPQEHPKGKRRLSASKFCNDMVLEWSKTHPIVLYLHGGAFALCGSNTHLNIISSLAMEDVVLFAVNYRRPPDVTIVEAVDDCYMAFKHLTEVVKIPPDRICICGDSAGGSLTILTLCRIRQHRLSLPMCAVLISPWCDLADKEFEAKAAEGVIMPEHDYLPYDAIVMISKLVIGNMNPDDPRINPIHADLRGLPPILVHAGAVEVLFNQIIRFYDKCKDEGLDVRLKIWPDMVHVPHVFTHVSEVAQMAVTDAARYIKEHHSTNVSKSNN